MQTVVLALDTVYQHAKALEEEPCRSTLLEHTLVAQAGIAQACSQYNSLLEVS